MVTKSKSRGRSGAPNKSHKRGGNPRRRKTVDKADTVETRKAVVPTQILLPLESAIETHLKLIKKAKDKAETQNGMVRNAYKAAKADRVNKKLVDFLFSIERGDPVEMRTELEAMALGLRTMGAPFRIVIHDALYKNPVDQAKAEGRYQAIKGLAAEPRYEEGTDAHEAYMDAFMIEQAKRTPGAEQLSLDQLKQAVADGRQEAHH